MQEAGEEVKSHLERAQLSLTDEITVDGFFQQYKDLLGGTISYGFPACCSIEELRERMEREHIRVFVIDSSLGMCGFVLAQEVELQCP